MLFDKAGDRLTPVHATKNGRRYHYYVSTRLIEEKTDDPSGWRLPAHGLGQAVVAGIVSFLRDDHQLLRGVIEIEDSSSRPSHSLTQVLNSAKQLTEKIQQSDTADQLPMVLPIIARIVVSDDQLAIRVKRWELRRLLDIDAASAPTTPGADDTHLLTIPLEMKRRGIETRSIIGGGNEGNINIDSNLMLTVAKTHAWFET